MVGVTVQRYLSAGAPARYGRSAGIRHWAGTTNRFIHNIYSATWPRGVVGSPYGLGYFGRIRQKTSTRLAPETLFIPLVASRTS